MIYPVSCANGPYAVRRVRRGVANQRPAKYVLDDKELERVSKLAHIELEDARTELLRAQEAAASMGKGAELEEADDDEGEGEGEGSNDEGAWVE
jgi:periodic tryptophan protein 1